MKNPRFVEKFSRYYSVDLENYMVQDEYVERGVVMNTRPE
jgi:formylmethanofuran dehydrogenase subunit A